jgi:hypothetical protein
MSEGWQILVAFFFLDTNIAERFLQTGDIELSCARKLLLVSEEATVTAEYIAEDTGVIAPVVIVYSLDDVTPYMLQLEGQGRLDCAS